MFMNAIDFKFSDPSDVFRISPLVYIQPKYDGLRTLFLPNKGFYSKRGHKYDPSLVAHIDMSWATEPIDGEFYCHGMSRAAISSAMSVNRDTPSNTTQHINFYAFDLPSRRFDTTNDRLFQLARYAYYHGQCTPAASVRFAPYSIATTSRSIDLLYNHALAQGYEGIVIRPSSSLYVPGRKHSSLFRLKDFQTDVVQIVGYELVRDSKVKRVGALVCVNSSGVSFKVGTGFNAEESVGWAKFPPLGNWARIKFSHESPNGTPVSAVYRGLVQSHS